MPNEFKNEGDEWTIEGWAGEFPAEAEGVEPERHVTLRLRRWDTEDEHVLRAMLLEPDARALVDGVLNLLPTQKAPTEVAPGLSLPDLFNVAQQATAAWGLPAQERMVVEEVGEFLAAFGQFGRGRATSAQVASEIADVLVVLASAMVAVGTTPDAVLGMVAEKVARLRGRLGAHEVERALPVQAVNRRAGSPKNDCHSEGCVVVPAARRPPPDTAYPWRGPPPLPPTGKASTTNGTGYPFYSGVPLGNEVPPVGTIAHWFNSSGSDCVCVRTVSGWDTAFVADAHGAASPGWFAPNPLSEDEPPPPHAVVVHVGDGTFPTRYDSDEPGSVKQIVGEFLASRRS